MEGDLLKDLGIHGRVVLNRYYRNLFYVGWLELTQYRIWCHPFVIK